MSGRLGPGRGRPGAVLPSGRRLPLADSTGKRAGGLGLPSELSYPHLPLLIKHHPYLHLVIKPTHLLLWKD